MVTPPVLVFQVVLAMVHSRSCNVSGALGKDKVLLLLLLNS